MGITEVGAAASPAAEEVAEVAAVGAGAVGVVEEAVGEVAAAEEEVAAKEALRSRVGVDEGKARKLVHSARHAVPFSDPDSSVSL